jgi:hypothetical protein
MCEIIQSLDQLLIHAERFSSCVALCPHGDDVSSPRCSEYVVIDPPFNTGEYHAKYLRMRSV